MKQRAARDPQNAGINYVLAVLYAKAGDATSSVRQLEALVRKNWTLGVDLHDFKKIQSNPQYRAIAARLRARQSKVKQGSIAATLNEQGIFPEGIAWDQSRSKFYIGNAPGRDIVAVQENGRTQGLRVSSQSRMLAPLGMRVEPDGKILWVATAAFDLMGGFTEQMKGRSALVAIDLQSSRVIGHFENGDANNPSLFNDVQPLGDGRRAIVSDSKRGTLYIASLGKNAMARMFPENSFESPNGLTYDPVGDRLFVADSLGISVVDVESNRHRRMKAPKGEYFGGVDGLSWWKGSLVGIQNAVGSTRIWSVAVSGDTLSKPKVLSSGDPRLGSVTTLATNSKGAWLIADPQFRNYGSNGKVKPKAQQPKLQLFHIPL